MRATLLVVAILSTASVAFYFGTPVHAAKSGSAPAAARKALSSKSLSLPLFFEPNRGQTAAPVKFLARGSGYGVYLTADEAVFQLRQRADSKNTSVIRMQLEHANPSAKVSGASPLPGKSNYFIGKDEAKWQHDVPHFAEVQYQAVYPGIDLVYHGNQTQLEYDFRVAAGADPGQIALTFSGASARIMPASGNSNSGDLVLSTGGGEVVFRAPHIYQPDQPGKGGSQTTVTGGFRQLAGNKIGFAIGDYDHSRELIIDPTLTYSTFLGGSGNESFVKVAVDSAGLIYLAGSTNSADFPLPACNNPCNNPPIQAALGGSGATNIFIAVINPGAPTVPQQLVYATYLGGTGVDSLAGVQVDAALSIYVAGSTTSDDFPTTSNAFQCPIGSTCDDPTSVPGLTHGFLSKISKTGALQSYSLAYSSYIGGNGSDTITGLAIDPSCGQQSCNAYVTGHTTSTNASSDYFPANPNAFQLASNAPPIANYPQFFASKINTTGSGKLSMLYSTYFGGGTPSSPVALGGGIAVDSSGFMYITGTTNMLPTKGPNNEAPFPLFSAQQSCLNQPSVTNSCATPTSKTDAFVAKLNPNQPASNPLYSTYIGGNDNDAGFAIAVDSSSNAYVTGYTFSTDWTCVCSAGFQAYNGGQDAFIAKIGPLSGSLYPLNYFTYLGGSGTDVGNDIKVDSASAAHVVGNTTSPDFPSPTNPLQPYGGNGDAFVALISTTQAGQGAGDYLTYLGGTNQDQGTGIALDIFGAAYVAGSTNSGDFPVKSDPLQPTLAGGTDAFVSQIGAVSTLTVTASSTSPSPNPVAAGTQVAFTFNITDAGDPASHVVFNGKITPSTGLASAPTAKVTSGTGTCGAEQLDGSIQCFISSMPVNGTATVEVDVTPSATSPVTPQVSVSGSASANGGPFVGAVSQSVPVVDFYVTATAQKPTIRAGDSDLIQVSFCPTNTNLGYSATITPSDSISPSMVTASTPTFDPTTVTLSGSGCQSTTLSIATVARPTTTGSLVQPSGTTYAWNAYAMCLPIGGLGLIGLGIGATGKRRRWLLAALLCLIAGIILLPGCGSSSTSTTSSGGTLSGQYTITITGAAGTGASHSYPVTITVQ